MRVCSVLAGVLAALLAAAGVRGAERDTASAGGLHLGADFRNAGRALVDNQNKFTIAGASAFFFLARGMDNDARDYFAGQRREGDLAGFGNDILGTGVPGAILGFSAWGKGATENSPELVAFGQANLEAMLATAVATTILKGAVRRERPDHSDQYSFPSGHTSTVAATAMTINEFYGWRAGVPAFLLTAVTAIGRMSDNRHWLSDTVGGASLGVIFGHAFAAGHRSSKDAREQFASKESWVFFPVFDANGNPVVQALRFF